MIQATDKTLASFPERCYFCETKCDWHKEKDVLVIEKHIQSTSVVVDFFNAYNQQTGKHIRIRKTVLFCSKCFKERFLNSSFFHSDLYNQRYEKQCSFCKERIYDFKFYLFFVNQEARYMHERCFIHAWGSDELIFAD